ncbi:MAG: hypothetical protein MZV70_10620 [Desulfobacterales bacterium]|nr:hypothetical protein [Desulfobacterales bacterium]
MPCSHLGVKQYRDISHKGFDLGSHLGKLVKHAVFIQGLELEDLGDVLLFFFKGGIELLL